MTLQDNEIHFFQNDCNSNRKIKYLGDPRESEYESEDDSDIETYDSRNKNIKVIELIDKEDDNDNEENGVSQLQEMNNDDLNHASEKNIKKIELSQKEEKNGEDGETDVNSKKLSVGELRALIVSKGLANQNSANKMKKLELIEALNKL